MVCFAEFGRHKVDSLCLRRVMIYEAVMAVKDGSCRWHKGLKRDVEEEHRSVARSPGTETGCNIHLPPS